MYVIYIMHKWLCTKYINIWAILKREDNWSATFPSPVTKHLENDKLYAISFLQIRNEQQYSIQLEIGVRPQIYKM